MAVPPIKDYPIGDNETEWDGDEAEMRVREFVGAENEPNTQYRDTFMVYDENEEDNFTAYKLPFVDVIQGRLRAVPRAIFSIRAVVDRGERGVKISEEDRRNVKIYLNHYYERMELEEPFPRTNQFYEEEEEKFGNPLQEALRTINKVIEKGYFN